LRVLPPVLSAHWALILSEHFGTVAEGKHSFGSVAVENGDVLGFVAFTTNINKLYKSIILKKVSTLSFCWLGKLWQKSVTGTQRDIP
jgi:hypothetical protein